MSGISGTILTFAILLYGVTGLQSSALVSYFVSIGITTAVTVISIFNSLTKRVFVHPDDKLFGNMFTYILFMAHTLTIGRFFPTDATKKLSYDAGVMILSVFIFVYLILYFGKSIGFHELIKDDASKRNKELVSRFVLFSVILGGVVLALKFLYDSLYVWVGYEWGVFIIGISTFLILLIIGVITWKKYEPVADLDVADEDTDDNDDNEVGNDN
ncbi:MAG: hypothetical protein ACTSWN_10960 [Promethearchaeota archaeon]